MITLCLITLNVLGTLILLIASFFVLAGSFELGFLSLLFLVRKKESLAAAKQRDTPLPKTRPKVAVIIPAHNESKIIATTLAHLSKCDHISLVDTFVVADNCTDNTAALAREAAVSVMERNDLSKKGKPYALQLAFKELRGKFDYFVLLDADAIPEQTLLTCIFNALTTAPLALQLLYRLKPDSCALRDQLIGFAFDGIQVRTVTKSYMGLSVGIHGNGSIFSSQLIEKVPYTVHSKVEDLEYYLKISKHKIKATLVLGACVWSEIPIKIKAAATQRKRWEGGRFLLIKRQFFSMLWCIIKGNRMAISPLLNLLTLPLSCYMLCTFILCLGGPLFSLYLGALGAVSIGLYLLAIMKFRGFLLADCKLFIYLPIYFIWKLILLPSLFFGANNWVRTKRNAE